MEIRKRYTAIEIREHHDHLEVGDDVQPYLSFGRVKGAWYSREYPHPTFDTEEEAIKYAWETSKHGDWLILPRIDFLDCWENR